MEWGHEVTLFASGDSVTSARLEAVWPTSLQTFVALPEAPRTLLLKRAFFSGHAFDVIHSHLDVMAFPCARRCQSPVVTTVHAGAGVPGLSYAYQEFHELPLVSLLNGQRPRCCGRIGPCAHAIFEHDIDIDHQFDFGPRPPSAGWQFGCDPPRW